MSVAFLLPKSRTSGVQISGCGGFGRQPLGCGGVFCRDTRVFGLCPAKSASHISLLDGVPGLPELVVTLGASTGFLNRSQKLPSVLGGDSGGECNI